MVKQRKKIRKNEQIKKEITKVFKENKNKDFTINQIADKLKIHNYRVELIMNELLRDSIIKNEVHGKNLYWKLLI
jgi:hypothetical protein